MNLLTKKFGSLKRGEGSLAFIAKKKRFQDEARMWPREAEESFLGEISSRLRCGQERLERRKKAFLVKSLA